MVRELKESEIISTSNFGGFCPIWTQIDDKVYIADTMEEMFSFIPEEKRILDANALISLLATNAIYGDRTILQGVYRMPWHSSLKANGELIRNPPIQHGNVKKTIDEASNTFVQLLTEELTESIGDKKKIYLLLTGGYDSRIVAGVLKNMQKNSNFEVVAVTWGMENSRDVNYSKRISQWLNWEWIHIDYTSELLRENFEKSVTWGGGEVSGWHLHAMDWFNNVEPTSLVIAASFGDSIGRAEFGAKHLSSISEQRILNSFHLFQPSLYRELVSTVVEDRSLAWASEENSTPWVRLELDKQENYMRRMLCHNMDIINQYTQLHQAFTSDKLISFIWSMDLASRNDEMYKHVLKKLDHRLYDLAWARTGVSFDGIEDNEKHLSKDYHQIFKWTQYDLRSLMEEHIFSGELEKLNIFDTKSIRRLWSKVISDQQMSTKELENVFLLATIAKACSHFKIKSPYTSASPLKNKVARLLNKLDSLKYRVKK